MCNMYIFFKQWYISLLGIQFKRGKDVTFDRKKYIAQIVAFY